MSNIFSHNSFLYKNIRGNSSPNRFNGAYYYSREIVKNIIPRVKTDRPWITINSYGLKKCDRAIVFIHNNLNPELYAWMRDIKDAVGVCGVPSTVETMEKAIPTAHFIYLPISVDVSYVEQFKTAKTKKVCYVGRKGKMKLGDLPWQVEELCGLPRERLLPEMAKYEQVYAVGRCAIEAKILGCEVLPYDKRFPNPDVWKIVDNSEAAEMLQRELDRLDAIS